MYGQATGAWLTGGPPRFFPFLFRYVLASRSRGELARTINPVLGGCQGFPSTVLGLGKNGQGKLQKSRGHTCTVKRRAWLTGGPPRFFPFFLFRYVLASRSRGELPRTINPVLGGCQGFPSTVLGLGKNGQEKLQKRIAVYLPFPTQTPGGPTLATYASLL